MLYTIKLSLLKGILFMDIEKLMFYAKMAVLIQSVLIIILLTAIIFKAIYTLST